MTTTGAVDELKRVPLFSRVDEAFLAGLEELSSVRRLARGETLFSAGDPADHLFIIRSGSVKVHVVSDRDTDLLLGILGPGAALGELTVIDGGPRSADATALAPTELLTLPAAEVRQMIADNPSALKSVAESLAMGLRRLTDQAADLVFLDLPRRLAKLLLNSAVAPQGPWAAELTLNQTEVAQLMGVSRQSVNRVMSGFAQRGWLEVAGSTITVRDPAALTRFAAS